MSVLAEIVAGFLNAGKTTIINQMAASYLEDGEKVLVVQYEKGKVVVNNHLPGPGKLVIEKAQGEKPDANRLIQLLDKHNPSRLIIEANGVVPLEPLLKILESRMLRQRCHLQRIISVINAATFTTYAANLGNTFLEPVARGDMLVLTGTEGLSSREVGKIIKLTKKMNKDAGFLELPSADKARQEFPRDSFFAGGKQSLTVVVDSVASFAMLCGFLFLLGFIFILGILDRVASDITFAQTPGDLYLEQIHVFITVFVSILLQAFPFILLGVLVSAIIQVFVPESFITSIFSKNPLLSTLLAVVAGVFFPVCDCAIIPVMRRLVQKGVPLSAAVTFMLAAPIVDPVVIASTFYAFPDNPSIALYRLFLGVSIAVVAGLVVRIIPFKGEILKQGAVFSGCSCGYCGPGGLEGGVDQSLFARIKGMVRHGGAEFFQVGQFLVLAAAFSTYIQTSVSPSVMDIFSESQALALLTMMVFAFILSICSTSDAFIARNFMHQFATGPVVGFMVFGAMLDIKNLLLLTGNFESKFVIRLVLLILVTAFVILYVSQSLLLN